MKTIKVRYRIMVWFTLVLLSIQGLMGCTPRLQVGPLQTESQSVELEDAGPVRVEIGLGAGNLEVSGGTEKLLEADFTYNVANLKPEVAYTDGTLFVRQPDVGRMPSLRNITDFRNQWNLRLNDKVPMDLSVDVGGGTSNLRLADLALTRLNVNLGASKSTVDLSGNWVRDLTAAVDAGAADLTVLLPKDVGVRIKVEPGPHTIEAEGLRRDGDVFINNAYGISKVTLKIDMQVGIGLVNLIVK